MPTAEFTNQDLGFEKVVAVDCETTGLSSEDRVVSLAIVECDGFRATGQFTHLLLNPGRPSHPRAQAVHGWDDDVLAGQPSFGDHVAGISEMLDGAVLIGHNIEFDHRFLTREFELCGLHAPWRSLLCSMKVAKKHWPGERAGLDACLERIGRPRRDGHHGALEDAFLSLNVLRHVYGLGGFLMPAGNLDPVNLVHR